jgi:hypothetical protein
MEPLKFRFGVFKMAILGEADREKYFPFVTLQGGALSSAILNAENQASVAAGRDLELTEYTEDIQAFTSLITLRYYPVNLNKVIRVQAFSGVPPIMSMFHRSFSDGDPETLSTLSQNSFITDIDVSQYQINRDGLIRLSDSLVGCFIRVTYWSGFDFSSDTIEVQKIKAAVAAILNYGVLS